MCVYVCVCVRACVRACVRKRDGEGVGRSIYVDLIHIYVYLNMLASSK